MDVRTAHPADTPRTESGVATAPEGPAPERPAPERLAPERLAPERLGAEVRESALLLLLSLVVTAGVSGGAQALLVLFD